MNLPELLLSVSKTFLSWQLAAFIIFIIATVFSIIWTIGKILHKEKILGPFLIIASTPFMMIAAFILSIGILKLLLALPTGPLVIMGFGVLMLVGIPARVVYVKLETKIPKLVAAIIGMVAGCFCFFLFCYTIKYLNS